MRMGVRGGLKGGACFIKQYSRRAGGPATAVPPSSSAIAWPAHSTEPL